VHRHDRVVGVAAVRDRLREERLDEAGDGGVGALDGAIELEALVEGGTERGGDGQPIRGALDEIVRERKIGGLLDGWIRRGLPCGRCGLLHGGIGRRRMKARRWGCLVGRRSRDGGKVDRDAIGGPWRTPG